jgi:hypothetical protein
MGEREKRRGGEREKGRKGEEEDICIDSPFESRICGIGEANGVRGMF